MAEPFVLRPMEEADTAAVAAIEGAAELPQRSPEARRKEFGEERTRGVVLEVRGAVVGVGSLWLAPDEAHIVTLAVAGAARRRGHGRRGRGGGGVTLEVRASNEAARSLYRACGFEEVGERRRYHAGGEDAVIMTRALGGDGAGG